MPTPPTFAALYNAAKAKTQTEAPELKDYAEGSNLDVIAGIQAVMADETIRVGLAAFKDSYVDTAEGAALDRRIVDYGGPVRNPASAAVATVTLTRSSYVGAYTVAAGTEVTGEAADGTEVVFEVDEEVVLGSGDSSASIAVTATSTGRAGNVPAGTLDTITGLPAGLAVTQAARAAGGAAVETDDAYRARFKLSRSVLPGSAAALEVGALSVAGVSYATVDDETYVRCEDGGYVAVYIGDPDAEANDDLVEAVEAVMPLWKAAGIEALVYASEREEIALELTVKVRANSGVTEDRVKDAVLQHLDTVRPGKPLYMSKLEAAVHELSPGVEAADVTDPTDREVSPAEPQNAIRTAADGSDITVTIVEV